MTKIGAPAPPPPSSNGSGVRFGSRLPRYWPSSGITQVLRMAIESPSREHQPAGDAPEPRPSDYGELNAAFAVLLLGLAGMAGRHPERVRDLTGRDVALMS